MEEEGSNVHLSLDTNGNPQGPPTLPLIPFIRTESTILRILSLDPSSLLKYVNLLERRVEELSLENEILRKEQAKVDQKLHSRVIFRPSAMLPTRAFPEPTPQHVEILINPQPSLQPGQCDNPQEVEDSLTSLTSSSTAFSSLGQPNSSLDVIESAHPFLPRLRRARDSVLLPSAGTSDVSLRNIFDLMMNRVPYFLPHQNVYVSLGMDSDEEDDEEDSDSDESSSSEESDLSDLSHLANLNTSPNVSLLSAVETPPVMEGDGDDESTSGDSGAEADLEDLEEIENLGIELELDEESLFSMGMAREGEFEHLRGARNAIALWENNFQRHSGARGQRSLGGHRFVITQNEAANRLRNRAEFWMPTCAQRIEWVLQQYLSKVGPDGPKKEAEEEAGNEQSQLEKESKVFKLIHHGSDCLSTSSCLDIDLRMTPGGGRKSCLKINKEASVGESPRKSITWSEKVATIINDANSNDESQRARRVAKSCPALFFVQSNGRFGHLVVNKSEEEIESVLKKRGFRIWRRIPIFKCFGRGGGGKGSARVNRKHNSKNQ